MYCRYCGSQLKENAKFCEECGNPVGELPLQGAQTKLKIKLLIIILVSLVTIAMILFFVLAINIIKNRSVLEPTKPALSQETINNISSETSVQEPTQFPIPKETIVPTTIPTPEPKSFSVGDTLTEDGVVSVYIESVSCGKTLTPPKKSNYSAYTYFQASTGNTFIILRVKAKNLQSMDIAYDRVASVYCTFDDTYNYYGYVVVETDNGTDLSEFASIYGLAPLNTGTLYYLMEVPEEMSNKPATITIYLGSEKYVQTYSISE